MTIDVAALLYDPIYNGPLGVSVTLSLGSDGDFTLVAVPSFQKQNLAMGGGVSIETVFPAIAVRRSELASNEISLDALAGGIVHFDGKTWRVETHEPRPSPNGESDGEEMLILSEIAVSA